MTYELEFLASALKDWRKLDAVTRDQFKRKLTEGLLNPRVPEATLSGVADRYEIKLRNLGFRLVYEVRDDRLVVVVIAVEKRERDEVYRSAQGRKID